MPPSAVAGKRVMRARNAWPLCGNVEQIAFDEPRGACHVHVIGTHRGNTEMVKFEVGKTYKTRSIVDADFWVTVEVTSRTAKTIKARTQKDRAPRTFRISEYGGVEQVRPWGNYSMCPIVGADRT